MILKGEVTFIEPVAEVGTGRESLLCRIRASENDGLFGPSYAYIELDLAVPDDGVIAPGDKIEVRIARTHLADGTPTNPLPGYGKRES